MKTIFSGLESSGKSLRLAMVACEIVKRNSRWLAISGKTRPIYSNMEFSPEFTKWATDEMAVPIRYWQNLDDLIKVADADVFIDEVGNYFDSRMWTDLSLDVRRWLTQGAKSGIEIYGSAQDFAQVDKAFRRLVNNLYHITKLFGSRRPSATKPPVRRVWGLCAMRELDPVGYDEDKKKFASQGLSIPAFFFIEKDFCDVFDTSQKILRSKPPLLKHIDRDCELDRCDYHKVVHV